MATIDTRPQSIDILAYAGDTLTLNINTDIDYSLHNWTGYVKSDFTEQPFDAEFTFEHPPETQQGFVTKATISATDTAGLIGLVTRKIEKSAPVFTKAGTTAVVAPREVTAPIQYTGIWDIQVELDDVVTTLVRGTIQIDADITRLP
jgi:hypothetical protein